MNDFPVSSLYSCALPSCVVYIVVAALDEFNFELNKEIKFEFDLESVCRVRCLLLFRGSGL